MNIEKLKHILIEKNRTISCAESITCGHIQNILGSLSGASNFFVGGITAYTLDEKANILHIDRPHAEKVNCVSQQVANEMAMNVCKLFGSNISVSSTGYAEKYPEEGIENPFAYFSICINGEIVKSGKIEKKGLTRVQMQKYVAEYILEELLTYII